MPCEAYHGKLISFTTTAHCPLGAICLVRMWSSPSHLCMMQHHRKIRQRACFFSSVLAITTVICDLSEGSSSGGGGSSSSSGKETMPIHRVLHAQRTYGFTLRLYAVIKPGTDARSCHEFNALQSNVHIQYRSSHGPFSKWAFYAADSHVLTDYDFVFFFEASMDLENFQWAEFWRRYAVYSSLWSNLPVIGALRQASPYFPLRPDWWQACGRGDIPFLNVDFVEQSFAMLNSSFAVWYLQRLVKIGLISEQTRLGLDWGVDAAWCAAAAEWAGKDAGCLLVLLEMQQFDVERSRRVLGTGEQLVNLWWSRLSVW
eukprot:CAMPEP_0115192464 /NCGR_PEP_ID=MMETSP0270-20121206/13055_1 /TAXON_ID=71861 /ORGANISM="Scrippsiella trochoidea, Strain CCMP3099" /LENGTH=314 /DNA_ID=CAMNT_0002605709 /DNA_START=409 /DNA_END=1350 /DNA_ORIENTATION=+